MTRTVAPYGSWKSPISATDIATASVSFRYMTSDGTNLYWIEGRPTENGRGVIVRRTPDGAITDITPSPFNVRTRAHEYGGGDFCVVYGTLYFSNDTDRRLYRHVPGSDPEPITPEGDYRYADAVFDEARERLLCVREDHTVDDHEPQNTVVAIDPRGASDPIVLISGDDFISNPRLSPDGTKLAWMTWQHPNMPWDDSELWVAVFDDNGDPRDAMKVGGGVNESVFQPEWSPDGTLYFVSDRNGWWNLYRWNGASVESVVEMEAEFALPQWSFGMATYTFLDAATILCGYSRDGLWQLARIDTTTKTLTDIYTSYTQITYPKLVGDGACFYGSSSTEPSSIVKLDLNTHATTVVRRSRQNMPDDH
ncbi:MAG: S9 family peptidase, partial [Candidatus Poribacteria bacterium]|nr:S9 family peptidase [Candidatus Poribacteria bacterium]